MPYSSIIVGTDGSPTANRAVEQASTLAASLGARLVIVTAFESKGSHDGPDGVPTDLRWMLTDPNEAERHARAGRETARSLGVTDVVVQAVAGDPAEKVLEAADDFAAGAIVVGSVGLAGTASMVLGSVASTIAHHAPCDVLIVQTQ